VAEPLLMVSPSPDLMAICSGGKIIYVSMEDGQPVEEGEGPPSLSCPFVVAAQAILAADLPLTSPSDAVALAMLTADRAAPALSPRCCDYLSRAPPLSA